MARIPPERTFFNNPADAVLGIAEKMLEGELAYHLGDYRQAFDHLREAVLRDDNLEYSEPWAWMHPPRHALAALLSDQGHCDEAEQVCRTDLGLNDRLQRCAQHPDNLWSLYGLVECLQTLGKTDGLGDLQKRLTRAQRLADIAIMSSCMCRTRTQAPVLTICSDEARQYP